MSYTHSRLQRKKNSMDIKENIKNLVDRGNIFVKPAKGFLASGINGEGRLEEPKNILNIFCMV